MVIRACLLSVAVVGHSALGAAAFCPTPMLPWGIEFPDPPALEPPAPLCMSSYKSSGHHDCGEWEIKAYEAQLSLHYQLYLEEVEEFLEDARSLAEQAQHYSACSLRESVPPR